MPAPLVLVGRPPTVEIEVSVLGEGGPFAPRAEAVPLERQRDQRRERVVQLRDVDIRRTEVGRDHSSSGTGIRGADQRIVVEVVRHRLVLLRYRLRVPVYEHRLGAGVPRALGAHDHDGAGAVGLETVVEQAERLRDPAGVHVRLARERLVVHHRTGVAIRVLARGQRHVGQMISRRTELVHVAPGEHGDLVDRPQQSPGPGELQRPAYAVRHARPRTSAGGASLARPPGDGDLALTGGHGHRRVTHHGATGAAAVARPVRSR